MERRERIHGGPRGFLELSIAQHRVLLTSNLRTHGDLRASNVAQGQAVCAGTCGLWRIGLHQGPTRGMWHRLVSDRSAEREGGSSDPPFLPSNINLACRVTATSSPANRSECARSQAGPHSDCSYSPSANATTEAPCLLPSLPWPPAQMTMYCLPPALKVIGVACALAGSSAFQISAPVSTSNARR